MAELAVAMSCSPAHLLELDPEMLATLLDVFEEQARRSKGGK